MTSEAQKKQNVRTGQALETNDSDPFAPKMRKLQPGQTTWLAHSAGTVSTDHSGACASGLRESSTHCEFLETVQLQIWHE